MAGRTTREAGRSSLSSDLQVERGKEREKAKHPRLDFHQVPKKSLIVLLRNTIGDFFGRTSATCAKATLRVSRDERGPRPGYGESLKRRGNRRARHAW